MNGLKPSYIRYNNKDKPLIIIRTEDILDRISTKDGLAYYGIHFNKKGFASCPFHYEKTPSFHYNKKTDRYHCFSCGKGGTIIDFVAEYFNYSLPKELPQVLEQINTDFNLGLGRELSNEEKRAYAEDKKLNQIILAADNKLKEEANVIYDKWSRIHAYLYRAFLEIDKADMELGDLIEQLDEALNDFTGNELRAWPIATLSYNQINYIEQAEEYIKVEAVSFNEEEFPSDIQESIEPYGGKKELDM